MRIRITAITFLYVIAAASAKAQGAQSPIAAGARLKLSGAQISANESVVTVVLSTRDSLQYSLDNQGRTRTVAYSDLDQIQESLGRTTNRGHDSKIGFLSGLVIGGIWGGLSYKSSPCVGECWFRETRRGDIVAGSIAGGVVGALAGAIVGEFRRTEKWE